MKNPLKGIKGIRVIADENLARHTSFHIGGRATHFVYVYTKRALRIVLARIHLLKMRYFLIGAGTNLLVADRGFEGVVLKLGGVFKRVSHRGCLFRCGGGVLIKDFLDVAISACCAGAEFMAGIPGTLGGAVKGNAGAFGYSVSDLLKNVIVMDRNGTESLRTNGEIGFAYRHSEIRDGDIIITIYLKLKEERRSKILARVKANLASRQEKHPTEYSAGSFFKNPPGRAAGELIEHCGLKGLSVGGAQVSEKHANYLINRGQACANDILALAGKVKKIVRAKTGIRLEEEVIILK